MDRNIEKEYKVLLSKEQFERLMKEYDTLNFHSQTNTYYDNKEHALEKKKGAMRIRTKEASHIFTLKLPCETEEGLYEFECGVEKNDASIFSMPSIAALLEEHEIVGPFHAIASLTTKRAVVDLEDAELCFDVSEYGDKVDYEIEYEYKKEHDGMYAFNAILKNIGISYDGENAPSKIQRALSKK